MTITIKGTKKEIRKEVHRLEEKGMLIKKCVKCENIKDDVFKMTFSYEIQYGDWVELEETHKTKNEICRQVAKIVGKTQKELKELISENELPYWRIGDKMAQYEHRLLILEYLNIINIKYKNITLF